MSVVNGQLANQTTFNNAFMSRTSATTSTVAKVALSNADLGDSGPTITNAQKAINKAFEGVGTTGEGDTSINDYGVTNYITNGNNRKEAIIELDAQLFTTEGNAQAALALASSIGTGAYNFTSEKYFQDGFRTKFIKIDEELLISFIDNIQTGSSVSLTNITAPLVRLTGAITSITGIAEPLQSKIIALLNVSGGPVTLLNDVGSPADERIFTGTGSDLVLENGQTTILTYDSTSGYWRISSGSSDSLLVTSQTLDGTTAITLSSTRKRQLVKVQSTSLEKDLSGFATQIINTLAEGSEVFIVGQDNDNYIVLDNGNGLSLNGKFNSYQYSALHLMKVGSLLVEIARRA